MSTSIYIKTQFEAYHRWKYAPEEVSFLRAYHRHIFHVVARFSVTHNDRDLEFFMMKRKIDAFIKEKFADRQFDLSCEQIATDILIHFRANTVCVSEDGENGAVVTKSKVSVTYKNSAFAGEELEGPNLGAMTLFVPADLSREQFDEALVRAQRKSLLLSQIYFGAGNILYCGYKHQNETLEHILRVTELPVFIETAGAIPTNKLPVLTEKQREQVVPVIRCSDWTDASPFIDSILSKTKDAYLKRITGEDVIWKSAVLKPDMKEYVTWLFHPDFDNDQNLF